VLSRYHTGNVAPQAATVVVASCGVPLPINTSLWFESKTGTQLVASRHKTLPLLSQWRRKVFIGGVKEAQINITHINISHNSKDNSLLRKAESQLIICCKDDFFRASDFKQIRESFCECTLEKFAQKQAHSVSSAKQRTYSPAKKSPTRPPAD
jgi:hypothetical protein